MELITKVIELFMDYLLSVPRYEEWELLFGPTMASIMRKMVQGRVTVRERGGSNLQYIHPHPHIEQAAIAGLNAEPITVVSVVDNIKQVWYS